MSRFRLMAVAGLVIAGSLIFACGGGSKTKDASPTSGSGDASPAAGKTAATASGGGSADPELLAVEDKFAKSTFTATYKATGAEADVLAGGTLSLVKDGDTKFRFDVTTQQDGKDVSIIFIQSGDTSAFCLKDAAELGALLGIEPGKGVCFKTAQSDPNNPVGSLQDLFKGVASADVTLIEKSKRTVAGQDGTCYKTKDNASGDVSTSCFTNDGVMLYVKTEGASPSEIEAQTVSTAVNADDFTLPYEERELPGGLGGQ
jgi:hypothetical protein